MQKALAAHECHFPLVWAWLRKHFLRKHHQAVPWCLVLTPHITSLISKTQYRTEPLVYIFPSQVGSFPRAFQSCTPIPSHPMQSHPHLAAFSWHKQLTKGSFRKQGETDVAGWGRRRKQGRAAYPWWKLQWTWGCWGCCGWRWSHCSCRKWQGSGWKWSQHVKRQWQAPADTGKNTKEFVCPVNARAQISESTNQCSAYLAGEVRPGERNENCETQEST